MRRLQRTVATVIAKAALAEQALISSSSCNMRLTRATNILTVNLDSRTSMGFKGFSRGNAADPVTSSGGGMAVLL